MTTAQCGKTHHFSAAGTNPSELIRVERPGYQTGISLAWVMRGRHIGQHESR